MQINLRHISLWRQNLLRVTVRHHTGEDANGLAGGRMMFEHQAHGAQLKQHMLFVVEQCITSDWTVGERSNDGKDETLFIADVAVDEFEVYSFE